MPAPITLAPMLISLALALALGFAEPQTTDTDDGQTVRVRVLTPDDFGTSTEPEPTEAPADSGETVRVRITQPSAPGTLTFDDFDSEPIAADWTGGPFQSAGQVLDELQQVDRATHTLTADIRFVTLVVLQGDTQIREGSLALASLWPDRPPPNFQPERRFAVRFDTLQVDDRLDQYGREYVFDGRWLVEKMPTETPPQFIKRRVVPDGQSFDLFAAIDRAPFWVPVGTDKVAVRQRFQVRIAAPNENLEGRASLERFVGNAVHLELIPRATWEAADLIERVDVWFDPDTLLPKLYLVTETTGDEQVTMLTNVRTNGNVRPGTFSTALPGPESGWDVRVTE